MVPKLSDQYVHFCGLDLSLFSNTVVDPFIIVRIAASPRRDELIKGVKQVRPAKTSLFFKGRI